MTALAIVSSFPVIATAQVGRTNPGSYGTPGLGAARAMIPGVNTSARMLTTERLACGPASGNPIHWFNGAGASRTVLRASLGKPATGTPLGSWTLRTVSPAGITPERTEFYFFDGVFTSATLPAAGAATRNFELRGTTTYISSGCERNGARPSGAKNARIWGSCDGGAVHLEISDARGVYATADLSADVTTACGMVVPANVSTTLNNH